MNEEQKFSIDRPSRPCWAHIWEAYRMCREVEVGGIPRRDNAILPPRPPKSYIAHLKRAADFVEAHKADPYEFMRILFKDYVGAYPPVPMVGSQWAASAYLSGYGDGPSEGVMVFRAETAEIGDQVLSRNVPVDELLVSGSFTSLARVMWCSDGALPEFSARYGAAAARKVKYDRELKEEILENYGNRASRIFRQSVPVEPVGSPVEVGPSKATPRDWRY